MIYYPGGPFVSEVEYHPRKKNHVIRIVFRDHAMYTRTSFRGAKTCKIGGKGYDFGHIDKFWIGHDAQIRKTHAKTRIYGLFSYLKNTCLGCVVKVLLRGWYPAWKTSAPPPDLLQKQSTHISNFSFSIIDWTLQFRGRSETKPPLGNPQHSSTRLLRITAILHGVKKIWNIILLLCYSNHIGAYHLQAVKAKDNMNIKENDMLI